MADVEDTRFFNKLTNTLGRLASAKARPQIPSRTLRRALIVIRISDREVKMNITHYWAVFVHQGRKSKRLAGNRFMVWYRNPKEDPRLQPFGGQTPPRVSQLIGLRQVISAAQFKADKAAGKIIFAQEVRATRGVPFFSNEAGGGMHGFVDQANATATPLVRRHILKQIGKENLREKDEAVLTLGLFAD